LHHIVAWPSSNSPTKNHEDRPRGSPPPSKSPYLAISSADEFLVVGSNKNLYSPIMVDNNVKYIQ